MAKKIRRSLAVLFLLLFLFSFLEVFSFTPADVKEKFQSLQFIPSIVAFTKTFGILSCGFLIIILLTLLMGRYYCSTICPLGVLQDIIIWIRKRIQKKYRMKQQGDHHWWRYGILGTVIVLFVFGNVTLLNVLDPYSIAGKLTVYFVYPFIVWGNNLFSGALAGMKNYSIPPIDLRFHPGWTYVIPSLLLILIVVLSFFKGRLFCNLLCPAGALLGLFSRHSRYKFVIDDIACKGCGVCEWECKSGCIDTQKRTIDMERCVACFNCVEECPTDVIRFEMLKTTHKEHQKGNNEGRRRFFAVALGFVSLSFVQNTKIKVLKDNTIPTIRKNPVSPPGAISTAKFTSSCTACQLCVNHCPTGVLQPAISEYGIFGIMQATMNYRYGYCNYECTVCGEICPTSAILPLTKEIKKLTQTGIAKFVKEDCIVEIQGTECGACSEHCPTKAVNMVPYKGLKLPEMKEEICIGCGACEHACPTRPFKAIYVEGNVIHALAKKPAKEKNERKTEVPEEFPF